MKPIKRYARWTISAAIIAAGASATWYSIHKLFSEASISSISHDADVAMTQPMSSETIGESFVSQEPAAIHAGMTRRQLQSLCGVDCLYAVNQYYGVTISYEDLAAMLAPSDIGVSMAKMNEIANTIGYRARALHAPVEDWLRFSSPLIVWLGNNASTASGHFVVIIPDRNGRRLWWLDPPNAGKWVTTERLDFKSAPILVLQWKGTEK